MLDLRVDNARLYPMDGSARPSQARSFAVSKGRIAAVDQAAPAREVVDARDAIVLPGLIDCHTHALFAGHRLNEHLLKLQGAGYTQIAQAGGGIMATVRAVRAASEQQLVSESRPRVAALAAEGVTTIEIKSGYGLDVDNELKMLRAIRALAGETSCRISPTFLGAHTVPPGIARAAYVASVCEEMLPRVQAEGLADCVDIFVESIAFDLADARRIFGCAREHGLKARVHAEQLTATGAAALAAELGALSCDHLEYLDDHGARAMAQARSVAVLLPGAYYFLRETRRPPVPLLREHAVAMAVASDLNPGTSPIASLLTAMHMSVTLFGLTPEEALLGVTCHAARALGRDDIGSLTPGRRADFTLWDIPEPAYLTYQLGGLRPRAIFIDGQRVSPT
ncbi:MAG TPA: imidazolonepropionase [Steroidobacteraceae bacterium]|nr:imidazolonepropionase [Steroidobacteraceae bacterium]